MKRKSRFIESNIIRNEDLSALVIIKFISFHTSGIANKDTFSGTDKIWFVEHIRWKQN